MCFTSLQQFTESQWSHFLHVVSRDVRPYQIKLSEGDIVTPERHLRILETWQEYGWLFVWNGTKLYTFEIYFFAHPGVTVLICLNGFWRATLWKVVVEIAVLFSSEFLWHVQELWCC